MQAEHIKILLSRKVIDVGEKSYFGKMMDSNLAGAIFEDITEYSKLEMKKGEYAEVSLCHSGDNTDTFCCEARYNIRNSNNARFLNMLISVHSDEDSKVHAAGLRWPQGHGYPRDVHPHPDVRGDQVPGGGGRVLPHSAGRRTGVRAEIEAVLLFKSYYFQRDIPLSEFEQQRLWSKDHCVPFYHELPCPTA